MMQHINRQTISRDEAFKLADKMISKKVTSYIIRDALIERGLSAHAANEIITEARRTHLNTVYEESRFSSTQIVLVIAAIAIILIIFFGIVNSVS